MDPPAPGWQGAAMAHRWIEIRGGPVQGAREMTWDADDPDEPEIVLAPEGHGRILLTRADGEVTASGLQVYDFVRQLDLESDI